MINSFGKKCSHCNKKIKKNYEFCPFCGSNLIDKPSKFKNNGDYGFLGKSDILEEGFMLPNGFNSLLGPLINELNKQITELDKEVKTENKSKKKKPVSGFSISIETSGTGPIKIKTFGDKNSVNLNPKAREVRQIKLPRVDLDRLSKIRGLPRKEPEASVRRLSDKIVYEINLPRVNSLEDININVIQNMVEIKAISNKEVYIKDLNVNYPLQGYGFKDNKLVLEFDSQ
ncbi:MAG TPA: zinc ribbon domain-containing protein [Candidatus Nanoarchaeia archaeon]|nr:zinc ribbon domain-containing protein [Candidatus Nanoarchaeia archaeon]